MHAPGVLLASFVPMLLTAGAFYHLNKVDTDCGTTFSWTTRALGPWLGWLGGWAIAMTGVLVIGSLADGHTIGASIAVAAALAPRFDLSDCFNVLISAGIVAGLERHLPACT